MITSSMHINQTFPHFVRHNIHELFMVFITFILFIFFLPKIKIEINKYIIVKQNLETASRLSDEGFLFSLLSV